MSCIVTPANLYGDPCKGSVTTAEFNTFISMLIVMKVLSEGSIDPTNQFTLYPINSTFPWLQINSGDFNIISPGNTYDDYLMYMTSKFEIDAITAINQEPPSSLIYCSTCVTMTSIEIWISQSLDLFLLEDQLTTMTILSSGDNFNIYYQRWINLNKSFSNTKTASLILPLSVTSGIITSLQIIFPNTVITQK